MQIHAFLIQFVVFFKYVYAYISLCKSYKFVTHSDRQTPPDGTNTCIFEPLRKWKTKSHHISHLRMWGHGVLYDLFLLSLLALWFLILLWQYYM